MDGVGRGNCCEKGAGERECVFVCSCVYVWRRQKKVEGYACGMSRVEQQALTIVCLLAAGMERGLLEREEVAP